MTTATSQDVAMALNSLTAPYVIYDLEFNLVKTNDAAKRLFGWEHFDVIGMNLIELADRNQNRPFFDAIEKTAKDGIRREVINESGDYQLVVSTTFTKIGSLVLTESRDLTNLYLGNLRERLDSNRNEEILNFINQPILVIDFVSQTITPNHAWIDLCGDFKDMQPIFYSLPSKFESYIPENDPNFNFPGSNLYINLIKAMKEVWKTGSPSDELVEVDVKNQILEITRRVYRWDYEDSPRGLFVTASEIKRPTQNIETLQIQQFAQGIAHDFGNISQAFDGYSKLLKQEIISERGQVMLEQLIKSADRALAISKRISEIARLQVVLNNEIELKNLLEKELKTLWQIVDSGVDLELEIEENIEFSVLANELQLQRIIENIVENANRALSGNGKIHIKCSENAELGKVILTISNNGPAIPQQIASRIFLPFVSTKKDIGTGLGLYLAHQYLISCGGSIELQNHNRNVAFVISLPRIEVSNEI